ncbi:hypothetical protein IJG72_02810 [bacterium]|nr:hypothetical protein [bacterium]
MTQQVKEVAPNKQLIKSPLKDEFIREHKKNGLVERLYNALKNLTGLGLGSKKVEKIIADAENGKVDQEDAKDAIKKYRNSQTNAEQVALDGVSIATALSIFLKNKKDVAYNGATEYLQKTKNVKVDKGSPLTKAFNKFANPFEELTKKFKSSIGLTAEMFKNPKRFALATALYALPFAAISKMVFGWVNSIGSTEFSVSKKDFNGAKKGKDLRDYNAAVKDKSKDRAAATFKNLFSGAINGLTAPLVGLCGGLVGVPLYFIVNSLNRFFISNRHVESEDRTFETYIQNLKDNKVLNGALALGIGLPVLLKTHNLNQFHKLELEATKLVDGQTYIRERMSESTVCEIDKLLFENNSSISKINGIAKMDENDWRLEETIKKLTSYVEKQANGESLFANEVEELAKNKELVNIIRKSQERGISIREAAAQELIDTNFFAAKFKQISNDGSVLARVLREDCPATRNLEEAQAYVDKAFGKGKYVLNQEGKYCLGVGTVAETYFAQNAEGQDVCIKVLKKGINLDKIRADKDAVIEMIKQAQKNPTTGKAYTQAEKTTLIQNIEDLAKSAEKELDLNLEMESAKKLANYTQSANVVKGIELSNDKTAYVMERARGISLESLMTLHEARAMKEVLEKSLSNENSEINNIFEYLTRRLDSLKINNAQKVLNGAIEEGSRVQSILNECADVTEWHGRRYVNHFDREKALEKINELIERVESKTPTYGNIVLGPADMKNLIDEYQKVLIEQYQKILKDGKVVHGDIHPGNVFVDIDALRAMPKQSNLEQTGGLFDRFKKPNTDRTSHKVFTLIDTGNVIEMNQELSMALLKLTSYVDNGNYKEIAKYVMQGVEGEALGGRTKEAATKIVEEELKRYFTSPDKPLEVMTTGSVIELSYNIMKKNGIIPNDIQLTLNKAIQSASNSYNALTSGLYKSRTTNVNLLGGNQEAVQDLSHIFDTKRFLERAQEKENLANLSVEDRRKLRSSEGNLRPNQLEYHIFKLKQGLTKDA